MKAELPVRRGDQVRLLRRKHRDASREIDAGTCRSPLREVHV